MASQDDSDFFEKEMARLIAEISSGFETLISEQNLLNRKLEEVQGVSEEYETLAVLWKSFYDLVKEQHLVPTGDIVPGTGGYVLGGANTQE